MSGRKFYGIWFVPCLHICPCVKGHNLFTLYNSIWSILPRLVSVPDFIALWSCCAYINLLPVLCVLCRYLMIDYWKWESIIIFNSFFDRVNDYFRIILEVGHPGIWSRDINFWGTVLGITSISYEKSNFLTSCPGLIRIYEISICHVLHCPYIPTPISSRYFW